MDRTTAVSRPPHYMVDQAGKTVSALLDAAAYVELLIRAGVTDAGLWPPGMEHGATALQRLHEIETACAVRHGAWDWELLEPAVQDEYDQLAGQLDALRDDGARIAWAALLERNPALVQ